MNHSAKDVASTRTQVHESLVRSAEKSIEAAIKSHHLDHAMSAIHALQLGDRKMGVAFTSDMNRINADLQKSGILKGPGGKDFEITDVQSDGKFVIRSAQDAAAGRSERPAAQASPADEDRGDYAHAHSVKRRFGPSPRPRHGQTRFAPDVDTDAPAGADASARAEDTKQSADPADARARGADAASAAADAPKDFSPQTGQYLATGNVSASFESGKDPGIVNRDPNRASGWDYGAWQMNTAAGTPASYVQWAEKNDPQTYAQLKDTVASASHGLKGAFAAAWRNAAAADPQHFLESQRHFMLDTYLGPLMQRFPELAGHRALQEAAFSTAVGSGPDTAAALMRRAGFGDGAARSPERLLRSLQAVRANFWRPNGPRYAAELETLLALNIDESSGTGTETA